MEGGRLRVRIPTRTSKFAKTEEKCVCGERKGGTSCTYFTKSSTFIEFSKAKRENYASMYTSYQRERERESASRSVLLTSANSRPELGIKNTMCLLALLYFSLQIIPSCCSKRREQKKKKTKELSCCSCSCSSTLMLSE